MSDHTQNPVQPHVPTVILEIDPDTHGAIYNLEDGGGLVAYLISTADTTYMGVAANRLWFSTDVTGKDFELVASSATPSTSGGLTYKAVDFSPVSTLPSYSSGWVIKRSGMIIGYAYYNGTTLNFVHLGSSSDFTAGDSFQWSSSLSISTGSTWYLASCPKA